MTQSSLYIPATVSPAESNRPRTHTGTGTRFASASGSLRGRRKTRFMKIAVDGKMPPSGRVYAIPESEIHHFALDMDKTRLFISNNTSKDVDVRAANGDHRWSELVPPETALTFAVVYDPDEGLCTFSGASFHDLQFQPQVGEKNVGSRYKECFHKDFASAPAAEDAASQILTIDLIATALPNFPTATTYNITSGFPFHNGPPSVALRSSVGTNCALDAFMAKMNAKDGAPPTAFQIPYHYRSKAQDDEGFYEASELERGSKYFGYDGSILDRNLNSSFTTTTTSTSRYIHLSSEMLASRYTLNFDANAHCNGCAAPMWSWDYVDADEVEGYYEYEEQAAYSSASSPSKKSGEVRKLKKKRPSNGSPNLAQLDSPIQEFRHPEHLTASASASSATLTPSMVFGANPDLVLSGALSRPVNEAPASPADVLVRSQYNHEFGEFPDVILPDSALGRHNVPVQRNIPNLDSVVGQHTSGAHGQEVEYHHQQYNKSNHSCSMRIPIPSFHVIDKVKCRTLKKTPTATDIHLRAMEGVNQFSKKDANEGWVNVNIDRAT